MTEVAVVIHTGTPRSLIGNMQEPGRFSRNVIRGVCILIDTGYMFKKDGSIRISDEYGGDLNRVDSG